MPSKTRVENALPHIYSDRSIQLPCSCVGNCQIVVIGEWHDDESAYVDFYTQYRQDTRRERLRAAWDSLRGKGVYHGVVWEPEQIERLRVWLNERRFGKFTVTTNTTERTRDHA